LQVVFSQPDGFGIHAFPPHAGSQK